MERPTNNTTTQPKALMTVSEVARRLRCSLSNAHALISSGKLTAYRVGAGGGGLRVTEQQLQQFLERSVVSPGEDDEPPLKHLR
jgi:excisionase family DNA binding protein